MNPKQAQRIRFGILAARHSLERARLTTGQVEYLEGCELSGWQVRDSRKAYWQEYQEARSRTAIKDFAVRAAELRKRWIA